MLKVSMRVFCIGPSIYADLEPDLIGPAMSDGAADEEATDPDPDPDDLTEMEPAADPDADLGFKNSPTTSS